MGILLGVRNRELDFEPRVKITEKERRVQRRALRKKKRGKGM